MLNLSAVSKCLVMSGQNLYFLVVHQNKLPNTFHGIGLNQVTHSSLKIPIPKEKLYLRAQIN